MDGLGTIGPISDLVDVTEYERWRLEISMAENAKETPFLKSARELMRIFKAQMPGEFDLLHDAPFNIFWSNVQTQKPIVYMHAPSVVVEKRYRDKDVIGRVAATILERASQYCVDEEGFHSVMKLSRDDWLRVGLGVAWSRYEPHFSEDVQVVYETVPTDYVHFEDFLCSPARCWEEVRWVARKSYLSRDKLRERFGETLGEDEISHIPLNHKSNEVKGNNEAKNAEVFQQACVYEIWDKDSKNVYWLVQGYSGFLDKKPDPLHLRNFFPCARPLMQTQTNDNVWPMADYLFYRMLAEQLNESARRIDELIDALRVAGVYDESCEGISRILDEDVRTRLIPVKNFMLFKEGGGFRGGVEFFPVDMVIQALQTQYQIMDRHLNWLYQISGMADIIRGASNPNETATAQRIKGRFASLRLEEPRAEMDRFVRDNIRIKAEIISEHFQPETLRAMTGVDFLTEFTEDPAQGEQLYLRAVELLRNDVLRTYRVDIETDSTIAIDEQAEKEMATSLVTAIGGFFESAIPVVHANPELGAMIGEMLMYIVRRHRGGKGLEGVVEEAIENLKKRSIQMQQPQAPQGPSPEMIKAQSDMQLKQIDAQLKQIDAQIKQQELQVKQQEAASLPMQAQIEQQRLAVEMEKLAVEREALARKNDEALLRIEDLRLNADLRRQEFFMKRSAESMKLRELELEEQRVVESALQVLKSLKKKVDFYDDPETGERKATVVTITPEGKIIDEKTAVFSDNIDGTRGALLQ